MPLPPLTRLRRPAAAVLAGGLVGSAARVGISGLVETGPGGIPVATLAVNLSGSLLLGFYLARRERTVTRPLSLQFWGIGVFGSFTTFSIFSMEVVRLLAQGRAVTAAGYVAASLVGGLVMAFAGQRLGSAL